MLIKMHPCEFCNSSDAYAEYTDNFYCFSCGRFKIKSSLERFKTIKSDRVYSAITYDKIIPPRALKWLLSYGLSTKEVQKFGYSYEKDILVLYSCENYWQGRYFGEENKPRYQSNGVKPFITFGDNKRILVLVEDIISAIKVSRYFSTSPMLGSVPMLDVNLYKNFEQVFIWNDNDKIGTSIKSANKLSELLGFSVKVIQSEQDPKFYNDKHIQEYVLNAF